MVQFHLAIGGQFVAIDGPSVIDGLAITCNNGGHHIDPQLIAGF